jgi:D-lactate dehydrogenase
MKKLLQPDASRIGRPPGPEMFDAVPESLLDGTPRELKEALSQILGQANVLHRVFDLVRFASDASPYRYIPQVVAMPRNPKEVAAILAYCRSTGRHAVFRAAGTSLNGQSQTDGILIEVRRHWNGCSVEKDGQLLRTKPGSILAHANAHLARFGRKLGPDPASNSACTVGGVIANNAGGMRCTLQQDAYHSLVDCTFVLPSGTTIDTSGPDAEKTFAQAEPQLAQGLMDLRNELLADPDLVARVRRKYSIRNTHGYRLCAFLDGATPLEIFKLLLVGSEGTLAFIAEAVLKTIPVPLATGVAFMFFESIDAAVAIVPQLTAMGASAVELMMAPALSAASQAFEGTPPFWKDLDPKGAALLVEFGTESAEALRAKEIEVADVAKNAGAQRAVEFTSVAEAVELAWHVREGLLGLVGKSRPPGTSLIIEDVCFPLQSLADGARDLQALLQKHGFIPGVAGHAAHGNLHFMLVAHLDQEDGRNRYSQFMREMVELIVRKYDGSLKAEHGTGLNMAPFVLDEWGEKATRMMWRIKELADPKGVLGPNVVLTRNPHIFLDSMKSVPPIETTAGATHCIECGFCEPVCPSRNVTTTPRQRIVLRREMARQPENSTVLQTLQKDYEYDAIETCAGDSTCSLACPIGIDTGSVMREFRKLEHGDEANKVALLVAKNWSFVEKLARTGLHTAEIVQRIAGVGPLKELTAVARALITTDLIPSVPGPMPQHAGELPKTSMEGAAAVYFPACINRIFGRDPSSTPGPSLAEALIAVSARAGRPVWIPSDVAGLCCSTPFHSKGYMLAHQFMASAVASAFWRWSDNGRLPIIVDATSCTLGLVKDVAETLPPSERAHFEKVRIIDSIQWCQDLLPHLSINKKLQRVALHPTCSMQHLHLVKPLEEIAQHLAQEADIPIGATCCGTAGDRGLLHPELVQSATRDEKESLAQNPADAYLSANRTCEMGMRLATGHPYESFVYLLENLSRPENET